MISNSKNMGTELSTKHRFQKYKKKTVFFAEVMNKSHLFQGEQKMLRGKN